jgi:integrase/recombinase XerD
MKQAKLLNSKEHKRLTAVINAKRYPTRNHTIVALSFYAGLRACEIASLKVKDVFDENYEVRDSIQLAASQTKGNHAGTALVSKRLAVQLKKFGR